MSPFPDATEWKYNELILGQLAPPHFYVMIRVMAEQPVQHFKLVRNAINDWPETT